MDHVNPTAGTGHDGYDNPVQEEVDLLVAARNRRMKRYVALAALMVTVFAGAAAVKGRSQPASRASDARSVIELTEGAATGHTRTLTIRALEYMRTEMFVPRMDHALAKWLTAHSTCRVQSVSLIPFGRDVLPLAYVACTCDDR